MWWTKLKEKTDIFRRLNKTRTMKGSKSLPGWIGLLLIPEALNQTSVEISVLHQHATPNDSEEEYF